MSLPADVCRCHDSDCPLNERCLRWIERDTPIDHPRVVHAESCFDLDVSGLVPTCSNLIEAAPQ